MKTVLITGFEPFGGDVKNPSQEVALALHDRTIRGRRVIGAVLPCAFGASRRRLTTLIRRHRPERVICLGLAGDRTAITPERVAINLEDARIPDNAGHQPTNRSIVRRGPVAYWSTLPVKAIVAELVARGWPAAVSQTAGTFVCNHVFYGLMHELRRKRRVRAGFIHLPWPAESRVEIVSSLSLAQMTAAVEIAVRVSLRR